ncbi:MAG: photosynthetic reaction center subunit H [Pseudomonadota bacterium]
MIFGGEFIAGIDLVDVCLWLFTTFFIGLVFYLQRESRREGYPLESETTGKPEPTSGLFMPPAKTFRLPHGQGDRTFVEGKHDRRDHALTPTAPWPGSPFEPTGDPMQDGVGPASYAEREDIPDLTLDGQTRIAPLRVCEGFHVAEADLNPIGLPVICCDGKSGGTVADMWVDRSEAIFRYIEVETGTEEASNRVLVPIAFTAKNSGRKPNIGLWAVTSDQLAAAPKGKAPDVVTRLEEDKISGYYGGGTLYATAERIEPVL